MSNDQDDLLDRQRLRHQQQQQQSRSQTQVLSIEEPRLDGQDLLVGSWRSDDSEDASEEDEDEEDLLGSEGLMSSTSESLSWITWWCTHLGHEYFCEVPEEFIEDDFNMTGLHTAVANYREAFELILDLEPDEDDEEDSDLDGKGHANGHAGGGRGGGGRSAADQSAIEASAELLYGLIHSRYIVSRAGLASMAEKYEGGHFGTCPRAFCERTGVVPVGLSDIPSQESVKLYCPNCLDVYVPPNSRFHNIDGAFFGTTFPHLFFLTFPDLLNRLPALQPRTQPPTLEPPTLTAPTPPAIPEPYLPRIYGFKVSSRARSGPKMAWLRRYIGLVGPEISSEDEEVEEVVVVEEEDPPLATPSHSGDPNSSQRHPPFST
ncbi:casein kinase 2 regulatory subunit [Savitreella phatthalungensis]